MTLAGLHGLIRDFDALKAKALEAAGNNEPWPPVEGDGDGLLYALWADAGFPPLPEKRPPEGAFRYLMQALAGVVWDGEDGGTDAFDLPIENGPVDVV